MHSLLSANGEVNLVVPRLQNLGTARGRATSLVTIPIRKTCLMSDKRETGATAKTDVVPANTNELSSADPTFDTRYFIRLGITVVGVFGAGIGVLFSLGVAQKLGWIDSGGAVSKTDSSDTRIHTCPMHPQIRQPGPGRCDICGMELVPAVAGTADPDEFAINVDTAARRLANIQTAKVERRTVFHTIETVGSIAFDESRLATISVYVEGRIERLFADYTGVEVEKGDHLVELYSPSLYSAQVEYLQSQKALSEMNDGTLAVIRRSQELLVKNTRQKLTELGMSEAQITTLEKERKAKSRLTVYSQIGGTVIEKMAQEGKYVKAGDPVYRIVNLSMVWLMLELFPEDAAQIRFGQNVEAELQSLPGEVVNGRVAFIDKTVDPKTRTVGVRVEILNVDGRMKPGDYATARVRVPIGSKGDVYDSELANKWISPMHPQIIRDQEGTCPICGMDLVPTSRYGYSGKPVPRPTVLVVPRDAVLIAGNNSVVYVETEEGRFEIRVVALGPMADIEVGLNETVDVAIVLSGLDHGESVATSGNFLIDSQMQLAGKPSLIDPLRAKVRRPKKPKPLSVPEIRIEPLAGDGGKKLEELYAAYMTVQSSLAADKKIDESQVNNLRSAGSALIESADVSESAKTLVQTIVDKSDHLNHMELKEAREHFKPISHSIIRLATQLRGDVADKKFTHFFCPMVKGGGGDWLQADSKLQNPYYGSQMLRCGETVTEIGLPANRANERE